MDVESLAIALGARRLCCDHHQGVSGDVVADAPGFALTPRHGGDVELQCLDGERDREHDESCCTAE